MKEKDEFWRRQVIEAALDHDTERHIAEHQAAVKANPAWARGHYQLGLLYQAQLKPDLAVEHFLKALSIDPRLADAHVALGRVYAVRGEIEKAWEHGRIAYALGNPDLLAQLERHS